MQEVKIDSRQMLGFQWLRPIVGEQGCPFIMLMSSCCIFSSAYDKIQQLGNRHTIAEHKQLFSTHCIVGIYSALCAVYLF